MYAIHTRRPTGKQKNKKTRQWSHDYTRNSQQLQKFPHTSCQDAGEQRQRFVAGETEGKWGESQSQAANLPRRTTPAGVRVTHTPQTQCMLGACASGTYEKLSLLQPALKHKEEGIFGEGRGVHHQTITMHVKYRNKENAAPSEKKKKQSVCESLQSLQICIAWMCGSARLCTALLVSFSSLFWFYCMQVDCRGCSDGTKAVQTLCVCLCPADSSLFTIILRHLAAKGAFFPSWEESYTGCSTPWQHLPPFPGSPWGIQRWPDWMCYPTKESCLFWGGGGGAPLSWMCLEVSRGHH